jgi:hypothetical protein
MNTGSIKTEKIGQLIPDSKALFPQDYKKIESFTPPDWAKQKAQHCQRSSSPEGVGD